MSSSGNKRLFVYECLAPGLPLLEPNDPAFAGVWPEPPYSYLFFNGPADELVADWIRTQPGWVLMSRYEIDYEQWQQVPQADQLVGAFVIPARSHLLESVPPPGAHVLRIDPGLVFGSGLHPTTRGCLLALEHVFDHHRIRTVVDFGTGTGVLAIASALLGATSVVAIDCNLLAIRVADGNFKANGVGHLIHPMVAEDPGVLAHGSDLLLMNIEWPCLTEIIPRPHWRRHALAILSGFMEGQWETLSHMLPDSHILIHRECHDGWLTVVLKADPRRS